jgi:hypothetical protein
MYIIINHLLNNKIILNKKNKYIRTTFLKCLKQLNNFKHFKKKKK